MKHTPGPWQVGHHLVDQEQKRSVHSADGWTICIASRSFPQDETFANMYLIAAAPDLLAACKLADDYIVAEYNDGSPEDTRPEYGDYEALDRVNDALRAAITAATPENEIH